MAMAFPYHVVFMIMLALLIMEAERSALQATRQCRSSFVARVGPRLVSPSELPMKPDKDEKVPPEEEQDEGEGVNATVCFDIGNINLNAVNSTGDLEFNLLISSVQWGVFLGAIPGGWASVCCTSQNVLLGGQLLMAIATIIVPLVAAVHWIPVVITECLVGGGMALMIPSIYNIMSDWESDYWRTTVVCLCLAGRPLGQLASFTLMSLTCEWTFFPGWIFMHFVIGFMGLVWCALWLWFGHRKAPCGGCLTVCCPCCRLKTMSEPSCPQRMMMLKVWSAVIKQNTVWGIIFAWCCAELMWMLLEMYSAVLNSIDYVNEIWNSGTLLATALTTLIVGVIADKVVDCSPESYRYVRKICDSLGKVLVIILSIVLIRLRYACDKWTLVMVVVGIVTAVHSLQFAGSYMNTVDIGDPCAGVTASTATLVSAAAKLALWNGLYYRIPFNVALLGFEPPLYAIAALLAFGIVIYALWGAPEVKLYLPPGWDNVAQKSGKDATCCICCPQKEPHQHIMQIMDQACRHSGSHASFQSTPGAKSKDFDFPRRARYDSETSYTSVEGDGPLSESPRRHDPFSMYSSARPEPPLTPTRVRYAENSPYGKTTIASDGSLMVQDAGAVTPRTSPGSTRSRRPGALEEIHETDYYLGREDTQFLPIREDLSPVGQSSPLSRERRAQRLSRGQALGADDADGSAGVGVHSPRGQGNWTGAESRM